MRVNPTEILCSTKIKNLSLDQQVSWPAAKRSGIQSTITTCAQQERSPNISSGKHTKNYGKSPFFMGKSTIYKWPFSIAMLVYQRVSKKNGNFEARRLATACLVGMVPALEFDNLIARCSNEYNCLHRWLLVKLRCHLNNWGFLQKKSDTNIQLCDIIIAYTRNATKGRIQQILCRCMWFRSTLGDSKTAKGSWRPSNHHTRIGAVPAISN